MNKKTFAKYFGILAMLGLLAACSGGGESSPGTTAPAASAAPAATPVGTVNGAATSATIGAAGGSVSTADGKITLTVPAGALATDTRIGIQPITNTAHGGLGAGYRLTPDGQSFAQPVVLKFTYTDQDLAGSDAAILGAAFQTAAGYWQWLGAPSIDSVAKTVSIGTPHFTDFSMVQGYRLQPLSKTLQVNENLALQVAFCYPPAIAPGDDLTPLGLACDTPAPQGGLAPLVFIDEWSVNGTLGGNATTGTVTGDNFSATYRAPATKPTPNTVAASARVNLGTRAKVLVVSNITIADALGYTGTVQFATNFSSVRVTNGTASVTWTQFEDLGDTRRYVPTGTIGADIAMDNCDPLRVSLPIHATVPGGIGPTLVVYTASSAVFPRSHQFALAPPPDIDLTFQCGSPSAPVVLRAMIFLNVYVGICETSPEPHPYTDEAQLAGSYSCPAAGRSATWNFAQQ